MKKTLLILVAAIGMSSLFAGEDLPVNGEFKDVKGALPAGWIYNTSTKPTGTIEMVKNGEKNAIKFDAQTSDVHIYFDKLFPAAPGERFEIEAKFTGKGKVGVGLYFYDAKTGWISGDYNTRVDLDGSGEVKRIIDIPAAKDGKTTAQIRIAVIAYKGTEATLTEVDAEKQD